MRQRVRVTVSVVRGGQEYQKEHSFAQWEENESGHWRSIKQSGQAETDTELLDAIKVALGRARNVLLIE